MSDSIVESDPSALIRPDLWFPTPENELFLLPGGATIFLANGSDLSTGSGSNDTVDGLEYIYNDQLAVEVHPDDEDIIELLELEMTEFPVPKPKRSGHYAESLLRVVFNEPGIEIMHIKAGIRIDQYNNGAETVPFRLYGYA